MARMTESSRLPPPPAVAGGSEKRFPQRYTVVEHLPSGASTVSAGTSISNSINKHGTNDTSNGSSTTKSEQPQRGTGDDAQRFSKNSLAMEERAKRDLRDTLLWVGRLSGSPVDRRLLREAARSMKPNTYRDVMTERWVADMCAYPPCENSPRKPYNAEKPMYRINLRAKKVFDTSAAMKFCSDECARRSIWYETVCLQQNAFEVADLSQPVQLLEDTEHEAASLPTIEGLNSPSVPIPSVATLSDRLAQTDGTDETARTRVQALPAIVAPTSDYEDLADNFLARLSIVEREPQRAPIPPSEDLADEVNIEDNPFVPPRGGMSLEPTVALQQHQHHQQRPSTSDSSPPHNARPPNTTSEVTVIEDNSAGLARRIEIDVDPEYRDLMDESWALYRQMKESGELT